MDNILRLRLIHANLVVRSRIINAIRSYFQGEGFLEVETPSLTATPIPEANIEPLPAGSQYLGASPELHMKQLLGAGYGNIFQICRSFRRHERGSRHNPEFTILEWYRVNADYNALMHDCERMIQAVLKALGRESAVSYQGHDLYLGPGWTRISVREAYLKWAGWDPVSTTDYDRFDLDMVNKVEPGLIGRAPVFLVDYPAAMASLARLKPGGSVEAERFELYAGGLELANGFSELIDQNEQKQRFIKENERRKRVGLPALAMPESLLSALPYLKPCTGCALGVDRLVMLFCNAASIDDVIAFTSETA